jgi:hypothetical protein
MKKSSNLPCCNNLNIAALSSIFDNTTNSYKYLFFISLLNIIKSKKFSVEEIFFTDIIVEMLANAWYPHEYFKLSFGKMDKISKAIEMLNINYVKDKNILKNNIRERNIENIVDYLSRYVPYRLISPFFHTVLKERGVRCGYGNELERSMPSIADEFFHVCKPLYKFNDQNNPQSLILNEKWLHYFEQHFAIIEGWALWNWLQYMQKRNPTTPSLSNKLFAPINRNTMAKQISFWKIYLEHTNDFRCIYSNDLINDSYVIDHYLPWSFVAHDQIWNLIPVSKQANSSKSNSLPDSKYYEQFKEIQFHLVKKTYKILSLNRKKYWLDNIEPYLCDMNIDESEILNKDLFFKKMDDTMNPLFRIARNHGFKSGWCY